MFQLRARLQLSEETQAQRQQLALEETVCQVALALDLVEIRFRPVRQHRLAVETPAVMALPLLDNQEPVPVQFTPEPQDHLRILVPLDLLAASMVQQDLQAASLVPLDQQVASLVPHQREDLTQALPKADTQVLLDQPPLIPVARHRQPVILRPPHPLSEDIHHQTSYTHLHHRPTGNTCHPPESKTDVQEYNVYLNYYGYQINI